MRNREARQLAKGDVIRPVATAMGYGRFSKPFTHTVAYVGGLAFSPWIVTTDGLQFAPWEVERAGAEAQRGRVSVRRP